jgi:hypothetical protein
MNLLGTGTPSGIDATDGPYTLGHDIVSTVALDVTALRFYKPGSDTVTRNIRLYSTGGSPGWGTAIVAVNVPVSAAPGWYETTVSYTLEANRTYTIAYTVGASDAYRSVTDGLASDIVNGPLKAIAGSGKYKVGDGMPEIAAANDHFCVDLEVTGGVGASSLLTPNRGFSHMLVR